MKKKLQQALKSRKHIRDFILYFIVGILATIIEWVVFRITNHVFHFHYAIATTGAFIISTFANWGFGRLILFKNKTSSTLKKELSQIYITSIVGLLMNLFIMWVTIEIFSFDAMGAKILATGLVFFWNFLIRKLIIYKE